MLLIRPSLVEAIKGQILIEGHFGFTSKEEPLHGLHYLAKGLLSHELRVQVAASMVEFSDTSVDAVVAPQWGALRLGREVKKQLLKQLERDDIRFFPVLKDGDGFRLSRRAKRFLRGKEILVVEDNLTTGGTVRSVVRALREAGAIVLGVAVMWNRGGVTAESLGVPWLFSVVSEVLPHYKAGPETCPGCKARIPLDQNLGHPNG